jgi:hypothetical protein
MYEELVSRIEDLRTQAYPAYRKIADDLVNWINNEYSKCLQKLEGLKRHYDDAVVYMDNRNIIFELPTIPDTLELNSDDPNIIPLSSFLAEELDRPSISFWEKHHTSSVDILRTINFIDKATRNDWLDISTLDDLLNKDSNELIFTGDTRANPEGYEIGCNLKVRRVPTSDELSEKLNSPLYRWYQDASYTWIPMRLRYTNFSGKEVVLYKETVGDIKRLIAVIKHSFSGNIRDLYDLVTPYLVNQSYDPGDLFCFAVSKDCQMSIRIIS